MPVLNTTASNDLATEVRPFYYSLLLHRAMPLLVHQKFAKTVKLPKGNGKTVKMRRMKRYPVDTDTFHELTEGVTPDGMLLKQEGIEATVKQYGAYTPFSDQVNVYSISCPLLRENTGVIGDHAGETLDLIAREAWHQTTTVAYANSRAGRANLVAGDKISDADIIRMRGIMAKNLVPRFGGANGFWRAIVSEEVYNDLLKTNAYQEIGKQQKSENLESPGQIKLYGIVFTSTTQAKVIAGGVAGAPAGVDVHRILVYGPESFGSIEPETMGMENIVKLPGSAGTADPLNQRQSQGWKCSWAGKVLNDKYALAFECAASQI